jgi:predicted esterase
MSAAARLRRLLAPEATLLSPRPGAGDGVTRRSFAGRSLTDLESPRRAGAHGRPRGVRAGSRRGPTGSTPSASSRSIGYSDGANIAVSLLLCHPGAPRPRRAAAADAAFEADAPVTLAGTDVLIATAARDPYVEPGKAKAERLARLLQAAGGQLTVARAAAGHELVDGDLVSARNSLAART